MVFCQKKKQGPLALGALYRRDHRAVQKSCYIQCTLILTGLGDIGKNARATEYRIRTDTAILFYFSGIIKPTCIVIYRIDGYLITIVVVCIVNIYHGIVVALDTN